MYILNDMCFLCFVNNTNIKSVFLQDDDGLIVIDKLQYVFSEIVNFKPDEPKKICTDCLKDLNYVYKFKQKCIKNILDLRDYFQKHTAVNNKCTVFVTSLTNKQHDAENQIEIKEETIDSYSSCEIQDNVVDIKVERNINDCTDGESNLLFEEMQRETFPEVMIKREPGEINQDIDTPDDPLLLEEMNTNYALQAVDTAEYITPDSDFDCTPEASKIARKSVYSTMPTKSSHLYESVYNKFIRWCSDKNIEIYSEDVMLVYFSELSNKMNMKGSTLWSQFSMIKSVIRVKNGVDISKYLKLRAYLKKMNQGYTPKKSKVFTKEQFETFLAEAADKQYLGMKVVLIIGISGACRCDEIVKITVDHIQDFGSMLHIKIPDSNKNKIRSFTIVGDNYINLYRKYLSLRPADMKDRRFFLKYKNGNCFRTVMGIHSIGKVPKHIATFLKLPNADEYTGHGSCGTNTKAAPNISAQKCMYMNCTMDVRIDKGHCSFFKFPANPYLARKWIENSGNTDLLSLTSDVLSTRKICERHFDRKYILFGYRRKIVVKHAAPYHYLSNKMSD